jgi:hypothetical protein
MTKITVIVILLGVAIKNHRKKRGRFDGVSLMLATNIAILFSFIALKLGPKTITVFFVLILLSNYINLRGFIMLTKQLKTPEGKDLQVRTRTYNITMHVLYGIVVILAFTPQFGPYCSALSLYPPVLTMAEILLCVNAVHHKLLHGNKYWLKWEDDERVKDMKGKEYELGYEPVEIIKPLFEQQMNTYVCYQNVLATLCFLIQIFAHTVVYRMDLIACHDEGRVWLH